MKLDELIKMYEEELQDILKLQKAKKIKDISLVSERIEAYAIQRFLKNLKNLPNELQDVNNNEQKEKVCDCTSSSCNRDVGCFVCDECNEKI